MANFWVNGIVAVRDKKPYIQLSNEKGLLGQLSMSEARQVAMDILVMASRTEADAMFWQWAEENNLGDKAGESFIVSFRDFRAKLDDEAVRHTHRGEVD